MKMVPEVTFHKANGLRHTLPVFLPILLVTGMTAALRIGSEIAARRAPASAPSPTARVLERYAKISELLRKKNNAAALAELPAIADTPVRLEGMAFRDANRETAEPQNVILALGIQLMEGARERREAGDIPSARAYAGALRNIGRCLVSSPVPTVAEQTLSEHFVHLANKTEARINQKEAAITPRFEHW